MSVLSPVIDYIDGPSRRIYLLDGITSFHPIDDIYKEVRNLRRTNENLRKFDMFCEAGGNVRRIGNSFTPRYLKLLKGTKIVAGGGISRLTVTGDIFTDDSLDPDIFDDSLLPSGTKITYYLTPPEAEVIVVNGSGGGGSGTVTSIAPNAITASSLATDAVNEIATAVEAILADNFSNVSVDLTPIQTDLSNLLSNLNSVKTKTDKLTFTVDNKVLSDIVLGDITVGVDFTPVLEAINNIDCSGVDNPRVTGNQTNRTQ